MKTFSASIFLALLSTLMVVESETGMHFYFAWELHTTWVLNFQFLKQLKFSCGKSNNKQTNKKTRLILMCSKNYQRWGWKFVKPRG
jgi:hypothetical protein